MADRRIIIIGAGIGGLATGCYAQMNGYDSEIFEAHGLPGGFCTAWERKGYTFDYCLHNLAGTRPGSDLNKVWRELGAIRDGVLDHDVFVRVEDPSGRSFIVYCDLKKLEAHLLELSPRDRRSIRELAKGIRRLSSADMMAFPLGGSLRTIRMIPLLGQLKKWGEIDMRAFAERFEDPFLRKAIPTIQYDIRNIPMLIPLVFLSGMNSGDMGWPKGGSLVFARNIAARYTALGGEIHYRSPIAKVLVEDGKAVGVKTEDGKEHRADMVISNADGRSTIYDMLEARYTTALIRDYYEKWPPSEMEMGLQVSFGLSRDLREEEHAIVLFLETPIIVDGQERDHLNLELFSSDTGLAPPGKGIIKVIFRSNYQYWADLRKGGLYVEEKERLIEMILNKLEGRFPGIRKQVEISDVATLLTAERFTRSFHGMQAWGAKAEQARISKHGLTRTLPGLQDFYMVGQWAEATVGISTAAIAGRNLVRDICKRDGKRFRVEEL